MHFVNREPNCARAPSKIRGVSADFSHVHPHVARPAPFLECCFLYIRASSTSRFLARSCRLSPVKLEHSSSARMPTIDQRRVADPERHTTHLPSVVMITKCLNQLAGLATSDDTGRAWARQNSEGGHSSDWGTGITHAQTGPDWTGHGHLTSATTHTHDVSQIFSMQLRFAQSSKLIEHRQAAICGLAATAPTRRATPPAGVQYTCPASPGTCSSRTCPYSIRPSWSPTWPGGPRSGFRVQPARSPRSSVSESLSSLPQSGPDGCPCAASLRGQPSGIEAAVGALK